MSGLVSHFYFLKLTQTTKYKNVFKYLFKRDIGNWHFAAGTFSVVIIQNSSSIVHRQQSSLSVE